jgi:hypothetical protein
LVSFFYVIIKNTLMQVNRIVLHIWEPYVCICVVLVHFWRFEWERDCWRRGYLDCSRMYYIADIGTTGLILKWRYRGYDMVQGTTEMDLWAIIPGAPSYGQGRDHMGPRRTSLLHGEHLEDVVLTGRNGTTAECSLNVPWMFPICAMNVPWVFPECALNVPWMFPECYSLNVVPWVFPECSLNVPWMCPECALSVS